jgi:hypothetical protein
MNTRLHALLPLLALPLVACAALPPPVASPSGEPLAVREETKTAVVTERVKVGEVEHKTNAGQTYAKSEVYENKERQVQYQVWKSYQGSEPISDDDLYRIAKDKEAEDAVARSRETGVTMNRVGLGLLAAGVAGMVGGYVAASSASNDATGITGSPGMYVAYGSSLVAGAGGVLTWLGLSKAQAEHPLEQDRARAAAARYNRALRSGGTTSTTSTTGATMRR